MLAPQLKNKKQENNKMTTIPNIEVIKTKMKEAWNAGDYSTFATYMEPGAVEILESWNIKPGQTFLDVACGAGQLAIPAARRGIKVTGADIAPRSIQVARARTEKEGLDATFDEADAECLPYKDNSFDVVATIVGAMFAPQPEKVAAELVRVCKPGGKIYMVNWTPQGMVGHMFREIGRHVAPPQNIAPPPLWGDEETVKERFGSNVSSLTLTKKIYPLWTYPFGVEELVQFFFDYYGPTEKAYAALDDEGKKSLRLGLERVFSEYNIAKDGTVDFVAEYMEVEAVKA
jgi:ubiquinone/menaquinone biosynthesis C-methylase UbiE